LNWDIVDAMSTVKELMLSPAGTVADALAELDALGVIDALAEAGALVEAAGVLVVEVDDEHPATVRAATAAVSPAQPSRR
jgi:hypothetical protein